MTKKSASSEVFPKEWGGFPWKGPPQTIEKAAHTDFQPRIIPEAKVKVFRTSVTEDMAELATILQKQAKGHVNITMSDRQFVAAKEEWLVFMSWLELYAMAAPAAMQASGKG